MLIRQVCTCFLFTMNTVVLRTPQVSQQVSFAGSYLTCRQSRSPQWKNCGVAQEAMRCTECVGGTEGSSEV